MAKRVDQRDQVRPQLPEQLVDRGGQQLGAGRGELAVLQEPGLVRLDGRQRVEVADRVQQLPGGRVVGAVDAGDEGLQHDAVDVRLRRLEHVVLDVVEHVERGHALGRRVLAQPPDRALERVLLAELEHLQLPAAVEHRHVVVPAGDGVDEPGDQRAGRRPLQHRLADHVGDEPDLAPAVERAEVVAVAGQQPLGDQLQQDGVVALEGGEDVGVGLEVRQPVLLQVARAAARLAAHLDGARWRARSGPP